MADKLFGLLVLSCVMMTLISHRRSGHPGRWQPFWGALFFEMLLTLPLLLIAGLCLVVDLLTSP
jgi:hypothetical protein